MPSALHMPTPKLFPCLAPFHPPLKSLSAARAAIRQRPAPRASARSSVRTASLVFKTNLVVTPILRLPALTQISLPRRNSLRSYDGHEIACGVICAGRRWALSDCLSWVANLSVRWCSVRCSSCCCCLCEESQEELCYEFD